MLKFIVLIFISSGIAQAQSTPRSLGEKWQSILQNKSDTKWKSLMHPKCVFSAGELKKLEVFFSYVSVSMGELKIDELKVPQHVLAKLYQVVPEKQIRIPFLTKTKAESKKWGKGRALAIAKHQGRWFFVACLKK